VIALATTTTQRAVVPKPPAPKSTFQKAGYAACSKDNNVSGCQTNVDKIDAQIKANPNQSVQKRANALFTAQTLSGRYTPSTFADLSNAMTTGNKTYTSPTGQTGSLVKAAASVPANAAQLGSAGTMTMPRGGSIGGGAGGGSGWRVAGAILAAAGTEALLFVLGPLLMTGDSPTANRDTPAEKAAAAASAAAVAAAAKGKKVSGAAANLQPVEGEPVTDYSEGTGQRRTPNTPALEAEIAAATAELLERDPGNPAIRHAGKCAENGCLAQAELAGINVKGATIAAADIGKRKGGDRTGLPKPPCAICQIVLTNRGVIWKP
jgi:hypothetical protein